MKRWVCVWMMMAVLACAVSAYALTPPVDCPVPEEKLHEAVLAYGRRMGPGEGEFMAEGHIVLGCEEHAETVDVYASIRYQEYGFMAGIFTNIGSGCGMIPVKMTFLKPDFDLIALQKPNDGTDYGASILRMLPDAIEESWGGAEKDAQIVSQMQVQARAYVESIGRTETVMDWRELDPPLELPSASVMAANALSRLYAYPLWVTQLERVEDGVRYLYEKIWRPDGAVERVTYTRSDGGTQVVDGDTGTLIFRKTRLSDGCVVEEIMADISIAGLNVTMRVPTGTRRYMLRVCEGKRGVEYARECVEESGDFVAESDGVLQLDAAWMRLDAWDASVRAPRAMGKEKQHAEKDQNGGVRP